MNASAPSPEITQPQAPSSPDDLILADLGPETPPAPQVPAEPKPETPTPDPNADKIAALEKQIQELRESATKPAEPDKPVTPEEPYIPFSIPIAEEIKALESKADLEFEKASVEVIKKMQSTLESEIEQMRQGLGYLAHHTQNLVQDNYGSRVQQAAAIMESAAADIKASTGQEVDPKDLAGAVADYGPHLAKEMGSLSKEMAVRAWEIAQNVAAKPAAPVAPVPPVEAAPATPAAPVVTNTKPATPPPLRPPVQRLQKARASEGDLILADLQGQA